MLRAGSSPPNDDSADRMTAGDLDSVELLIKPVGADCNLDCTYCFYHRGASAEADRRPEAALGRSGRMTDAVLRELVRQAMQLRRRKTIFCWQGGEPALAGIPFFERAISYMKEFGRGGQVVGNAIQTNGVLVSDAWAGFLRDYSFQVGVSLDGPPALHDLNRRSASGRGTHRLALGGARRLALAGVEVNCLSVVTDLTVASDVYPYLLSQGFRYLQFIPCLHGAPAGRGCPGPAGSSDLSERRAGSSPARRRSSAASCQLSPEHYGDFLCELFDLWWNGGEPAASIRLFDSILTRISTGSAGSCDLGPTCGDYVAVEHDGSVYPCDFFVSPDRRLGNITETPLDAILGATAYRRFKEVKKVDTEASAACSGCRWLLLCHGGCPAYWRQIGASDNLAAQVTPLAADSSAVGHLPGNGRPAGEPGAASREPEIPEASWRYCSSFRQFLGYSHERLELLAG